MSNHIHSSGIPNPPGPMPPPPDPVPLPEPTPLPSYRPVEPSPGLLPVAPIFPPLRRLRQGCYLVRYTPRSSYYITLFHYDGTLRVQHDGPNTISSGDLYYHPQLWGWPYRPTPCPRPADGIPILPRNRYRYYLRVTRILEWYTFANSFTLGFEMHRFDQETRQWTNEGEFTARMAWTTPPAGYPTRSDYLEGEVKNSRGTVVGTLAMGWVSSYLRRVTVEIDKVQQSEWPLDNGGGDDWRSIFDEVGWDVTLVQSTANVTEPSGEGWSNSELHSGMLAWRDSADLDHEWRYHLMCVRQLDATSRGIMYDAYGGDSNNIPREGAAISSHWVFENQERWGSCRNRRFGLCTGPYFRTAVHELGHAMLLYHPVDWSSNHIMQVTPQIAANASPPVQFPDNIVWSFSPQDQMLLRHLPDNAVRPGGIPFGVSHSALPISPADMVLDAEGLELEVSPVLEAVPIGAPVRVNFALLNTTRETLPGPASLSMKRGHVAGRVIDPAGTVRYFSPIVRILDGERLGSLKSKERMSHGMTLLRGPQGALFPAPGMYRIIIDVTWEANGVPIRANGQTSVMVTPPENTEHAKAALKILGAPDALLSLAIGGDHLKEGNQAIQAALDDPVLRPHYAYIEAKRFGRRFRERAPNLEQVSVLLDEETVMSPAEVRSAAQFVQDAMEKAPREVVNQVAATLQDKGKAVGADDETMGLVEAFLM